MKEVVLAWRHCAMSIFDPSADIQACAGPLKQRRESLHPAPSSHSSASVEMAERAGVLQSTVRLSIGVEQPEDIMPTLAKATNAT